MFGFLQPRGAEIRVQRILLRQLQFFQWSPELLQSGRYSITSDVSPDVVDLFFARLGGDMNGIVTPENARQLRELCDELGFSGFDHELGAILGGCNSEVRKQLVTLRDRVDRHSVLLEEQQRRVLELERQLQDLRQAVGRLTEEVSQLRAAGVVTAQSHATPAPARSTQQQRKVSVSVQASAVYLYNPSNPLEGIIADLTRKCGGNVHEKGVVEITASSQYMANYNYQPQNAADLGTDSVFRSAKLENQWIRYDFKEQRVGLTSYSITSAKLCRPKSWVLEVSNDGSEGSWHVVDSHENCYDLNGIRVTCNFQISNPLRGSFRFIRLRLTGPPFEGNLCLCLTALEVFGTLSSQ